MILTLFTLMLGITFFLVVIGYWLEAAELKFLAWTFLFLISLSFLLNGIDYPVGENVLVGTDNYTIVFNYANYTNHTLSFFLTLVSVVMFISVFFEIRRARAP